MDQTKHSLYPEVKYRDYDIEITQQKDNINIIVPEDDVTIVLYDTRGSIIMQTKISQYYNLPTTSLPKRYIFFNCRRG